MFCNRADAAHLLARRFKGRELRDPLVLAIPRGGVVTGAVLAKSWAPSWMLCWLASCVPSGNRKAGHRSRCRGRQGLRQSRISRTTRHGPEVRCRRAMHQLEETARRSALPGDPAATRRWRADR